MEIHEYLVPVSTEILPEHVLQSAWLNKTYIYTDQFPDLDHVQVALFGLDDGAADAVRKKLYTLIQNYQIRIADLGNIRRSIDDTDTEFAISTVVRGLIDRKIFPLFICAEDEWVYAAYNSYERSGCNVNYTCIHSEISLWDQNGQATFLNKMITHRPNYLFNICHLGYQTYFVDPETLNAMQKMFFDLYRLGWVNTHIEETEPILRGTDLLSIHASSIRLSDAPGQNSGSPNGFFGDEICRIGRYAGMSGRLSSIVLAGLQAENDRGDQTAMLYAQLIWYIIDGLMARTRENPEENPDGFTKYIIAMRDQSQSVQFFKSNRSERWWMEVPNPHHKAEHHGPYVVPCSYNDYLEASQDEIPERWWNAYQRLL